MSQNFDDVRGGERVAEFLQTYRSARFASRPKTQEERLGAFLDELGRHRSVLPPKQKERDARIDIGRFQRFVLTYRALMEAARGADQIDDIWRVAGLKRDEVRTASVLAWILDHRGSHGFGNAVLAALLDRLVRSKYGHLVSEIDFGRRYTIHKEFCAFSLREDRVDIAIEGANCIVLIEVKIDAALGPSQLERYCMVARSRALAAGKKIGAVWLLANLSFPQLPDGVAHLTWWDVAAAIRTATNDADRKQFSSRLLLQYADHVSGLHSTPKRNRAKKPDGGRA